MPDVHARSAVDLAATLTPEPSDAREAGLRARLRGEVLGSGPANPVVGRNGRTLGDFARTAESP
jgi:hypothetical protein